MLQNVPPALLIRFLREHRSEWADSVLDAYSSATLRGSPYAVPGFSDNGGFVANHVIIPLAYTVENEEVIILDFKFSFFIYLINT